MRTFFKTHLFGKSIAVHVSWPWAEDLMFPVGILDLLWGHCGTGLFISAALPSLAAL